MSKQSTLLDSKFQQPQIHVVTEKEIAETMALAVPVQSERQIVVVDEPTYPVTIVEPGTAEVTVGSMKEAAHAILNLIKDPAFPNNSITQIEEAQPLNTDIPTQLAMLKKPIAVLKGLYTIIRMPTEERLTARFEGLDRENFEKLADIAEAYMKDVDFKHRIRITGEEAGRARDDG